MFRPSKEERKGSKDERIKGGGGTARDRSLSLTLFYSERRHYKKQAGQEREET